MKDKDKIICLTGFMGCGKSSVGRVLAERLGCGFTDLDDYIVSREGCSIAEMFKDGEKAFRKIELEALKAYMDSVQEPSVLALGGGTFTIDEARSLVLERSRSFYLRTSLECIRKRLGDKDDSRPLFADASRLYEARRALYEQAAYTLDTDELSPEQLASAIIDILSS